MPAQITASVRPQILSLTGLRFLAAFSILYAHSVHNFFGGSGQFIEATSVVSNAGMTLFFVLSGFVLHYNYCRKIVGWRGRYDFFVARFSRLYPLYVLFFFLDPLLVRHTLEPLTRVPLGYFFTLTQSWFPIYVDGQLLAYALIMGAWSISTEVFLYLFYLAIANRMSSTSKSSTPRVTVWYVALATAAFVGIWFASWYTEVVSPQGIDWRWILYVSPYLRAPEFLLGVLLAHGVRQYRQQGGGHWLLAGTVLLSLPLFAEAYIPHGGATWAAWGFAPGIACIIYVCSNFDNRFTRTLSSKPCVAMGDASYSLYMGHPYVFLAFMYVKDFPVPGLLASWAIAIGLSLLGYRYFEKPARRWVRGMLMAEFRYGPVRSP